MASTVDYGDTQEPSVARSRSVREAPQTEPLLPIQERKTRGRSPTSRVQLIANQLARAQDRALVKGQMRHQLGRFAQAFAKKRQEPEPRPSSAQPIKTRTFDEIAEEEIPRDQVPFGASLAKQRTTSEGALRHRFRGQLVR